MQQEQNQAHPIAVAQEFMKRAELKGGEVEVYAQTFNYLAQILTGELVVVAKEHLEESKDVQEKLEAQVKELREALGEEEVTEDQAYKPELPLDVETELEVVD